MLILSEIYNEQLKHGLDKLYSFNYALKSILLQETIVDLY